MTQRPAPSIDRPSAFEVKVATVGDLLLIHGLLIQAAARGATKLRVVVRVDQDHVKYYGHKCFRVSAQNTERKHLDGEVIQYVTFDVKWSLYDTVNAASVFMIYAAEERKDT